MNTIEELIQKECPEGVEYLPLGEVCEILDSQRKPVAKGKRSGGHFPYYGANGIQDYVDSYIFDGTFILMGEDGSVINPDRTPILNWAVGKIWVNNHAHILKEKDNIALLRYVFYALQCVDVFDIVRGTPPKLNQANMRAIEIPVPPLSVQHKIVEILDKFTSLEAELQAELEARKKQYEYYLDQLYSLEDSNYKIASLSDYGTFTRGRRFVRNDVVESGYPCIHYGDMYTYYGVKAYKTKTFITPEKASTLRFAHKGDVVIVGAGENKDDIGVGVAWFGDESPAVHDACYIYKHSDELDPMYISFFLRTHVYHQQIKKYVSEAKICAIAGDGIGKAMLPIPPLTEQKRIVSILEKFEALINDQTASLAAEIKARHQQYEYYRDRLLTFSRKEN